MGRLGGVQRAHVGEWAHNPGATVLDPGKQPFPEAGTVTKAPTQTEYKSGESVTLTASPEDGYRFLYCTGDVPVQNDPSTVVTFTFADEDKTVTARFEAGSARPNRRPAGWSRGGSLLGRKKPVSPS